MPNPNKDPERLDRHSGTGRRGLPKKEGYGKYGWGDIMDEAEMIQKGEIPDQDEVRFNLHIIPLYSFPNLSY